MSGCGIGFVLRFQEVFLTSLMLTFSPMQVLADIGLTIMFLALNRLGLPCRFLGSTCHAWPEIWNPDKGMWMQLDLNGCDDPDKCPDCTIKNPWFGLREKCCPDGYDFNASGECEAKDGSGKTVSSIDCPPCIRSSMSR